MRRCIPLFVVCVPVLAASADTLTSYRALILDPAMHAYRYFPLTEAAGTTALDESPNAANGAYAGGMPIVADGPFFNVPSGGHAPQFAGDGRYMTASVPDFADAINGPDGATVIAWFKSPRTDPGTLVGSYESTTFSNGFEVAVGKSEFFTLPHWEKAVFAVTNDVSAFRGAAVSVPAFADNDWHMIACSFRQGAITICFDSVPEALTDAVSQLRGPLHGFTTSMCVGAEPQGPGHPAITPFLGAIAHVSLHSTALSPEQVLALWRAGNGYEPLAVHGVEAIRPWFDAAAVQRVDAMILGDSNLVLGTDGGKYGHQFGMAQGLRRVFPIYASAVIPGIGTQSWSEPTNGIGPLASDRIVRTTNLPPHIGSAVPPFTEGFPTAAAYAGPALSIPSNTNWGSPTDWESPDLLIDFSADLRFHFQYATFAGGEGVFHPRIRLHGAPGTTLAGRSIVTAPLADALIDDYFDIPAGPRACGHPYAIHITDLVADLPAQGPFALLYTRFVLPGVQSGAAMTPAWSVGGVGARAAADVFWNRTTLQQLGAYIRQVVRHQPPGVERLLFQIIEGQNDAGDGNGAIDEFGAPTTVNSSTLRGQKLNTLAVMARVRAAWMAQGYDPARLHFLLGPYHPSDRSESLLSKIPYVYLRGWRELAIEHPEYNITAMDAYAFTSPAEFNTNSWYRSPLDQAHLNKAGYLNFGIKTWRALRDAVNAPSQGACCASDGNCEVHSGEQCTTARGVFRGGGTLCTPALCPRPAITCCYADGSCQVGTQEQCAETSGSPQGACDACVLHACPQPPGACCFSNGACTGIPQSSCAAAGGTPGAPGSPCAPNPCSQTVFGACCRNASCTVGFAWLCSGPGTRFAGDQSACNAQGDHLTPCCRSDFNQSGALSIQDLFDFLSAWFGHDPSADWDGSGSSPTVQDVFSFLAAWFTGCPPSARHPK